MSQSPTAAVKGTDLKGYLQSWDALGAMIRRGQSFSGRERNCVFLNIGDTRWADVSGVTGLDLIDDGRAVATVDWDHDGDLDLWIANRTGPRVRYMQNNIHANSHYLQLQLLGNQQNRDAIGARVEVQLAGGGPTLIKSLHAGGGFVSQSSKWLHFGLGAERTIDHISVRWPDGHREVLRGMRPDRRYVIVRGPGAASDSQVQEQPRGVRHVTLASSTPKIPPPTELARIVLTRRRALPELEYQNMRGERVKIEAHGKPMLINLWASWCANCVAELSELAKREDTLRERGLTVVALCADDLISADAGGRPPADAAQTVTDKLGFPFEIGIVLPESLKELTLLHSGSIYREQLPMPSSFLVDGQGRVTVIYKGRVSMDQLLADLRLTELPLTDLAAAFPFPGRNGIDLFPMTAVDMARAYEEGGDLDDAEQELVRYLVRTRRALNAKTLKPTTDIKQQLERTYHSLALMLRRQGRTQESLAVLEQAISLLPNSEKLRRELSNSRGSRALSPRD